MSVDTMKKLTKKTLCPPEIIKTVSTVLAGHTARR